MTMSRVVLACLHLLGRIAVRPSIPCGLIASLLIAGCGGGSSTTSSHASPKHQLKIAWLYTSPKFDHGYDSAMAAGEAAVKQHFGSRVVNVDTDNVPFSAQTTQVASEFVTQGASVLVDTAGFGNLFTRVCTQHTALKCFEVAPEGQMPPNTVGWTPQWALGYYVAGVAAGLTTRTNVTGFILPSELPTPTANVNAFALGCRSVNQRCIVRTVNINSYYNPPAETRAATTLINAHADVLSSYINDQSFCATAQQRGVHAIGEFIDASASCPHAIITSVVTNFAPFYVHQIADILNNSWQHENALFLSPALFQLGKWGTGASASVRTKVEKTLGAIRAGGLYPFTGPIYDSSGHLRVMKGQRLSPAFVYGKWTWKVQGVS